MSFMLWTAQSISPARIASSRARTKTPCPPISWRGTWVEVSPCVLMITFSDSIPSAVSFLMTVSVWTRASLLPRVPIFTDIVCTPV